MGQYTKTKVDGHTVDNYTAASVEQVKTIYKLLGGTGSVYVVQGSYNPGGISASAGTHDGGGVVDFGLTDRTDQNWTTLQKAARWACFAAWHRTPLYRRGKLVWTDHCHSAQVGNIRLAHLAAEQVVDYRSKPPRNGLAGHPVDNSWRPDVIFAPAYPLAKVSLHNTVPLAKKVGGNIVPRARVRVIQRALNLKLKSKLKVDGKWGPATKKAYAQWEKKVGITAADGIPSYKGLVLLGAGRFNVN